MVTQIPLVLDFIDRFVIQQQPLQVDMTVNDPSEKPMLTISVGALFKNRQGNNPDDLMFLCALQDTHQMWVYFRLVF